MRKVLGLFVVITLGGCYASVGGDGRGRGGASFGLILPEILPPLVVVEPGMSVVGDLDDEVFYSDGYYWARQDQGWYRTHDHRRGWARVEDRQVPRAMVESPPGRYRRYRAAAPQRERERRD
jgi:hypothetical protein